LYLPGKRLDNRSFYKNLSRLEAESNGRRCCAVKKIMVILLLALLFVLPVCGGGGGGGSGGSSDWDQMVWDQDDWA
jgi:hypothetical protein